MTPRRRRDRGRKLRKGDYVRIPDEDGSGYVRGTVIEVDGGRVHVLDPLGPWWFGRSELIALPRPSPKATRSKYAHQKPHACTEEQCPGAEIHEAMRKASRSKGRSPHAALAEFDPKTRCKCVRPAMYGSLPKTDCPDCGGYGYTHRVDGTATRSKGRRTR